MNPGGAARAPLFVRVFVLMLVCVAVIQLMNLLLLIAAWLVISIRPFQPGTSGHLLQLTRDAGQVFVVLAGAWLLGLQQEPEPCAAADLLHGFSWDALAADSQDRSIPDDPFSIGL